MVVVVGGGNGVGHNDVSRSKYRYVTLPLGPSDGK